MKGGEELQKEILAHFEEDMAGSVPESIRMLERYSPGAMEGFYRLRRATTTDSSLPKKVRELIIIAVEAALKKDPIGHARIAVEAGATAQEIHDAVALSLWLAGMPAYHHGMKAVQAAEQLLARRYDGYPAAPVTLMAAAPPGGGWHQTCEKTLQAILEERLVPVDVHIVTRPGGLKMFEETVGGRGDPHTLIAFSPGLTLQMLMKGSKYTYADVTPIAAVSTDYGAIVVSAASPISSLPDLLAAFRKDPAAVAAGGGSGPGAMHHGMVGVVAAAGGIAPSTIRYVGSAGVAEGIATLLRGDVPVVALGASDVIGELRTGAVRILAVLSEHRLPGPFREIPTAREQGFDVIFPMWRGFYGPPEMPEGAVHFWTDTFRRMVGTPTWARLLGETAWFPFLLTGDEFRAFLDVDTRRYAALGSRGS